MQMTEDQHLAPLRKDFSECVSACVCMSASCVPINMLVQLYE